MDNSYFIYSDYDLVIEKLHNCNWEFLDRTCLVEFGYEISSNSIKDLENIDLFIVIPWLNSKCTIKSKYNELIDSDNTRFIFNDSVNGIRYLNNDAKGEGLEFEFASRDKMCILPFITSIVKDGILKVDVNLKQYKQSAINSNIYLRFSVEPKDYILAKHNTGITKSTVVYDLRFNEKRNIPATLSHEIINKNFLPIHNCFCLLVLPNKYSITFIDDKSLKSIRGLELDSFKNYLNDTRLKDDSYFVIFNKKKANEEDKLPSFSFYSIFADEKIGFRQFAFAFFLNSLCSLLFYIGSIKSTDKNISLFKTILKSSYEVKIAILIMVLLLFYLVFPRRVNLLFSFIKTKIL